MSEWISVKERLPDTNEDVLVCHRNGFININARLGSRWWLINERNPVTNWMPLPEPPKEG